MTRKKAILGLGAVGIAVIAFAAGVVVDRRFPTLFTSEPAPPSLLTPAESTVLTNGHGLPIAPFVWEFTWSEVPRADRYQHVIIWPSGHAESTEVDEPRFRATSSGISYPADSLAGWSWKVRAWVGGRWTKWSETRTFTIEPARR